MVTKLRPCCCLLWFFRNSEKRLGRKDRGKEGGEKSGGAREKEERLGLLGGGEGGDLEGRSGAGGDRWVRCHAVLPFGVKAR